MKRQFVKAEVKVIKFECEDILTRSLNGDGTIDRSEIPEGYGISRIYHLNYKDGKIINTQISRTEDIPEATVWNVGWIPYLQACAK